MWMIAVPAMKTIGSPASRGWLTTSTMTATGAYSTAAAVKNSQTKHTAPAAAACLLNRFQLACAMAATRISTIAVGLTVRLLLGQALGGPAVVGQAAAGKPDRALEASLP